MNYLVHVPEGNLFLTREEIFLRVKAYLDNAVSEFLSPFHVWYEGFEGCGRPSTEVFDIIVEGMTAAGWQDIGPMRFEKFGGVNPSFKCPDYGSRAKARNGVEMVLHQFHQNKHYMGPDGRVFWLPVIEVFDIRCFERKDGKYIGTMVEIDPTSDYARQMVEVELLGKTEYRKCQ